MRARVAQYAPLISPEAVREHQEVLSALRRCEEGDDSQLVALAQRRLGRRLRLPERIMLSKELSWFWDIDANEVLVALEHLERWHKGSYIPERRAKIRRGIRSTFLDVKQAIDLLAEHGDYGQGREEILASVIEEELAWKDTRLYSDKELVRRVVNNVRREARQRREEVKALPLLLPDDLLKEEEDRSDLAAVAATEHLERLIARAGLSPQERQTFLLLGHMTDKQAAKELGRSYEQVRQEKYRARRKLRRAAAS